MIVTTTNLWRMSATGLAEAIRSKQVSSQEVIESHLRRIEAVNRSINAIVIVLAEQALEAAKAADRVAAAGGNLPAFHGVPFTSKENAVQVIEPRYGEDVCLDAAAVLEDRLGIITPIDPR